MRMVRQAYTLILIASIVSCIVSRPNVGSNNIRSRGSVKDERLRALFYELFLSGRLPFSLYLSNLAHFTR